MAEKRIRDFNMDLERVLLIFMVIVLHYNNRGMGGALNFGAADKSVDMLVRLSQSLCICAVNAFLILSGLFTVSEKIPYRKAIWLLVTCSFYRVIGYIVYVVAVTGDFSVRTLVAYIIPSNWYVCLFVTVMLVAPFINSLFDKLEVGKRRELMAVLTVLFVIVPSFSAIASDIAGVDLSGLATITLNGDISGFTITSFIYCYCLGRFIRFEKENILKLSKYIWPVIFVVCAALATLLSYKTESVWSYSCFITVAEAFALTNIFLQVKIKNEKFGTVISAVGGCGLGIFIWHTMPVMIYGYWVHWNIDKIGELGVSAYIINLFGATVTMYLLSFAWVYLCRVVVGLIKKRTRNDK